MASSVQSVSVHVSLMFKLCDALRNVYDPSESRFCPQYPFFSRGNQSTLKLRCRYRIQPPHGNHNDPPRWKCNSLIALTVHSQPRRGVRFTTNPNPTQRNLSIERSAHDHVHFLGFQHNSGHRPRGDHRMGPLNPKSIKHSA